MKPSIKTLIQTTFLTGIIGSLLAGGAWSVKQMINHLIEKPSFKITHVIQFHHINIPPSISTFLRKDSFYDVHETNVQSGIISYVTTGTIFLPADMRSDLDYAINGCCAEIKIDTASIREASNNIPKKKLELYNRTNQKIDEESSDEGLDTKAYIDKKRKKVLYEAKKLKCYSELDSLIKQAGNTCITQMQLAIRNLGKKKANLGLNVRVRFHDKKVIYYKTLDNFCCQLDADGAVKLITFEINRKDSNVDDVKEWENAVCTGKKENFIIELLNDDEETIAELKQTIDRD